MNHFCTLFDSYYLTRGLAMYHSLINTEKEFKLYIFCFDQESYTILKKMTLPQVTLVSLDDFETPELVKVKNDRTKAEYCWTCTPFTLRYVLDHFKTAEVTYLDADLFFFNKPGVLLEEFHQSNQSVMISEHRYTKAYDQSATSGIYCVQFMTFKNNKEGIKVLQWWQDRCLEWCYNRFEEGKFGDQKYLDKWPQLFDCIHVMEHLGGGTAPWNIQQYKIGSEPSVNQVPIVFYHFHGLKWCKKTAFDLGGYKLDVLVKQYIYIPYVYALKEALKQVNRYYPAFDKGIDKPRYTLKKFLSHYIKRRLKGNYNCIQIKDEQKLYR